MVNYIYLLWFTVAPRKNVLESTLASHSQVQYYEKILAYSGEVAHEWQKTSLAFLESGLILSLFFQLMSG